MSNGLLKILLVILTISNLYFIRLVNQYDGINDILTQANQSLIESITQFCGGKK